MVRIFLVDDHEVVRMGLRGLIDAQPDLETVGEAGSCAEALATLPRSEADVAVLDVRLPDGSGIELCRELRERMPGLRSLILTSFTDEQAVIGAVLAGANGYVLKDIDADRLLDTLRTVAAGRALLDVRATEILMNRMRAEAEQRRGPLGELTQRERELLRWLGEGLTNREIAGRMFLSERTVKNYVSQLLHKLGLDRRIQAAIMATKLGLSPGDPGSGRAR
ncbi:response regulator transcription factor [Nocardia sp. CDC159]|uniref:Response regulator transcription factor n=1 Tax=Nocardia pulmonis TaxID=2951408 RepID=A0A9X2E3A6_9NOCA|nr:MULTISPECIES: response regulator transcription factor [Nocardia]MCM6772065.1 response regulator transcription factor [Nocardia pulmonis]MCM6785277.1 response regulator transcription factor [Nocardia sp. CDC159]